MSEVDQRTIATEVSRIITDGNLTNDDAVNVLTNILAAILTTSPEPLEAYTDFQNKLAYAMRVYDERMNGDDEEGPMQ